MNDDLLKQIRTLEREQMIAEIERLTQLNGELVVWIEKRKNKIHPTDPIYEVLEKLEGMLFQSTDQGMN